MCFLKASLASVPMLVKCLILLIKFIWYKGIASI